MKESIEKNRINFNATMEIIFSQFILRKNFHRKMIFSQTCKTKLIILQGVEKLFKKTEKSRFYFFSDERRQAEELLDHQIRVKTLRKIAIHFAICKWDS